VRQAAFGCARRGPRSAARRGARRILGGVPRNDPTDTGGLFIGRRPGTGPLHYRAAPERAGGRRRRVDAVLAAVVLALEALLCVSVWGPQPLGWLWVGSQVVGRTDSNMLGVALAFFGILATTFLTLALANRLDGVWRLLRRAAGHDQRDGALARIFGATAIVALVVFAAWFLIVKGPAPSLAPQ
jgi:hypothetical protein